RQDQRARAGRPKQQSERRAESRGHGAAEERAERRGDGDQKAAARVALRPVQREQPRHRRLLRLVSHHTAGFDVSCDGTGARRSISAATAPASSAATAYVTKAAWIPNSDHARPPATGPSVTPTVSNSPKSPITRAWRRRGDASEIQAVAAGQINDP